MASPKATKLIRKQNEAKEKERQEKAQAFLEDYGKVVKKHGIEWTAELSVQHTGIVPRIRLKEVTPAAVMNWSDAQRQNLETRKECKHDLAKDGANCSLCGLASKHWGVEDVGVTAEYEKAQLKRIAEKEAEEKAKKSNE